MLKPYDDNGIYVNIGEIVLVYDIYHNYLGRGIFLGCEDLEDAPFDDIVIELPDKSIIHGYECWWIAEKETISLN